MRASKVSFGNVEIERGLPLRFIPGAQQAPSVIKMFRFEAFALTLPLYVDIVDEEVENAFGAHRIFVPAIQAESLLHNFPHR
jgi:hypothetical protein